MPEREIAKRGGAVRWRTIKLGDGQYRRVAVVRKRGAKGGRTVAGPVHASKGRGRRRVRVRKSAKVKR